MTDFENQNGMNNEAADSTNTGANANNGTVPNSTGNPYAYQNGYYRNTTPHQDEAVHNTAQPTGSPQPQAAQPDAASSYTYANFYSNPNSPNGTPDNNGKKPKKKHTGLKVTACVLAMALVSGASIGIYEGVRSSLDTGSSIVTNQNAAGAKKDTSDTDNSGADQTKTNGSSNSESWIQLAATEGSMSVADIVKKVTPSVVGVQASFQATTTANPYGGFFGYGGSDSSQGTSQEVTGVGTGIVMSADGYIVTNAHVIYDDEYGYGEATAVQVQMSDQETTYDARIVAYDKEADLAVLKVEASDLTPAEFGDSSSCEVGEMVVAIGNPLGLEFQNTVTCGIISALNRKVTINDNTMTLIQTDTAINSGNSGGPLINGAGQVIGINSAKMSSSYSSNSATIEGIGFAIPMTEAKTIIDDLINYGYVTGRPQLGITCQDVSEAVSQAYQIPVGAYIISVTAGGAADVAGLQPADVITAIDGQTITTTEELNSVKNEHNAGDEVTLTIVRNGQTQDVTLTLEEVTNSQN